MNIKNKFYWTLDNKTVYMSTLKQKHNPIPKLKLVCIHWNECLVYVTYFALKLTNIQFWKKVIFKDLICEDNANSFRIFKSIIIIK